MLKLKMSDTDIETRFREFHKQHFSTGIDKTKFISTQYRLSSLNKYYRRPQGHLHYPVEPNVFAIGAPMDFNIPYANGDIKRQALLVFMLASKSTNKLFKPMGKDTEDALIKRKLACEAQFDKKNKISSDKKHDFYALILDGNAYIYEALTLYDLLQKTHIVVPDKSTKVGRVFEVDFNVLEVFQSIDELKLLLLESMSTSEDKSVKAELIKSIEELETNEEDNMLSLSEKIIFSANAIHSGVQEEDYSEVTLQYKSGIAFVELNGDTLELADHLPAGRYIVSPSMKKGFVLVSDRDLDKLIPTKTLDNKLGYEQQKTDLVQVLRKFGDTSNIISNKLLEIIDQDYVQTTRLLLIRRLCQTNGKLLNLWKHVWNSLIKEHEIHLAPRCIYTMTRQTLSNRVPKHVNSEIKTTDFCHRRKDVKAEKPRKLRVLMKTYKNTKELQKNETVYVKTKHGPFETKSKSGFVSFTEMHPDLQEQLLNETYIEKMSHCLEDWSLKHERELTKYLNLLIAESEVSFAKRFEQRYGKPPNFEHRYALANKGTVYHEVSNISGELIQTVFEYEYKNVQYTLNVSVRYGMQGVKSKICVGVYTTDFGIASGLPMMIPNNSPNKPTPIVCEESSPLYKTSLFGMSFCLHVEAIPYMTPTGIHIQNRTRIHALIQALLQLYKQKTFSTPQILVLSVRSNEFLFKAQLALILKLFPIGQPKLPKLRGDYYDARLLALVHEPVYETFNHSNSPLLSKKNIELLIRPFPSKQDLLSMKRFILIQGDQIFHEETDVDDVDDCNAIISYPLNSCNAQGENDDDEGEDDEGEDDEGEDDEGEDEDDEDDEEDEEEENPDDLDDEREETLIAQAIHKFKRTSRSRASSL